MTREERRDKLESRRSGEVLPRTFNLTRTENLPCINLGEPTNTVVRCPTCTGAVNLKVFGCKVHGTCTLVNRAPGVTGCCKGCREYAVSSFTHTRRFSPDENVIRYDETNLYPELPKKRFNSSIIDDPDGNGYLFSWRDGWAGSDIWVCRMSRTFTPVGQPTRLDLKHLDANYGREDPTLFRHRGKVHVAFVGVVRSNNRVLRTSMLYARLGSDLTVEGVFSPKAPGVPPSQWQKNWQFFDHDDELYAVYSIAPHKVLRLEGDRATWAYDTPTPFRWTGGELRGGSSPVRVGDEYWCFFHDKVQLKKLFYRVGLYTFEAKPPFRVQRYVPYPVVVSDPLTNPGNYCDCLFPRGAVRTKEDGRTDWVLSCGVHDRFIELHRLSHDQLERTLVRVTPPEWFRYRSGTGDESIYASVVGDDEYGLIGRNIVGGAVLDVGGHVGCFSYLATVHGASVVDTYEPYPESYDLLAHNVEHMTGVRSHNKAVGKEPGRGRFPPAPEVAHSGGWSVTPGADGSVDIEPLDTMIDRLVTRSPNGRIRLLKIDCEGGEWGAFSGATRLHLVDEIVGEYHRYVDPDGRKWGPEHLQELLSPFGFDVTHIPRSCGWGPFEARRSAK